MQASLLSRSTNRTAICAIPSRCRCWRKVALRRLSAAKCCRMCPTLGSIRTRRRSGYEISFTRYFYKPQPLRTLEEIRADIEEIERETAGLLEEVLVKMEAAG